MINLKTDVEIQIMQKGGKILREVLKKTLKEVKPGVSLAYLDRLAEKEILRRGAFPSFKKVKGYHWSICSCVNDVVVHGIPNDYVIQAGDIVGIDCGVYYQGFHTDSAWTVEASHSGNEVKRNSKEIRKFLETGEKALSNAIAQVKVGNYIYDISWAIQETIEKAGYSVVKTLVGHGIGRELHEEPQVPGFVKNKREETPRIDCGMVLAIEVIYNMGQSEVVYKGNDGWTIATKDGKISGLFEKTVAATQHGCLVLS